MIVPTDKTITVTNAEPLRNGAQHGTIEQMCEAPDWGAIESALINALQWVRQAQGKPKLRRLSA